MGKLVRFGVSMEEELLAGFDAYIRHQEYKTRSEAFRDLIRAMLIEGQWQGAEHVAGAVVFVYDHHRRNLVNRLLDIQHHFHDIVVSTQHIHCDEDNCLEIIAVRGTSSEVRRLFSRIKALKGVKHASLARATTGRGIA